MMGAKFLRICLADDTPGKRSDCPNSLHDHPLPDGYLDASDEANRRLRKRWTQKRCPECKLMGWIKP